MGNYSIRFVFEDGSEPITVEAKTGRTILEVALLNDIELNHNCGGVCACSTCHVYIEKGMESLEEITDKEEDFVDRARDPRLHSRLSCQCDLLEGDGEIEVIVPDQSTIIAS
ncbi:MAG: 2Fe-2S iron-sulfur cluster binding domain-containing protein [Chitinophagales bacterium]|nr:2Fe-2S iron-sulfur cluster binding domain-containing protein [Chitinophagales bacterium]HAE14617.1 ferredoxin [Bacteroidota bacterium]HAE35487.1 ferredoxin [Bacteroidota bacterium]HPE97694.1 2Fe-2S iron-sulfur cluster-binding protein [Chitinophagales bacterium]HPR28658.1 2Fe-2S iron-sulfur cluster-binding protein [Chitinophagales bacterium]